MTTIQTEITEITLEKISKLSEKTGLSKQAVTQTALILGTMKLEEWANEDIV